MNRSRNKKTQAGLEQRARELLKDVQEYPDRTVEEVFGKPEEWIITVGEYELLLIPFSQEWCWYDPVHNDWPFTGYKIGEARFTIRDGLLSPPAKKSIQAIKQAHSIRSESLAQAGCIAGVQPGPARMDPPKQPGMHDFCTSCGHPLTQGKKFCGSCGTVVLSPVSEEPSLFCPACGQVLAHGKEFCGNCGKRVQE